MQTQSVLQLLGRCHCYTNCLSSEKKIMKSVALGTIRKIISCRELPKIQYEHLYVMENSMNGRARGQLTSCSLPWGVSATPLQALGVWLGWPIRCHRRKVSSHDPASARILNLLSPSLQLYLAAQRSWPSLLCCLYRCLTICYCCLGCTSLSTGLIAAGQIAVKQALW